ncbi:MAG: response regulator transcription factor [Bryobacter sp.]|nr:response regulator transcription factor [Bryobacter sp.]
MSVYTVFAREAEPVAAYGLESLLAETEDLKLIGHSQNSAEALMRVAATPPDIMLIDQSSGLRDVFNFVTELRVAVPSVRIVLWVVEMAEVESFRALQIGARGIVRRSLPVTVLYECLRSVAQGNLWLENTVSTQVVGYLNRRNSTRLTPREREIVKLVCRGMKNKEIAEALLITPGTVKVHLMHIFEKTGVKDRFELALQGNRILGLEPPDPPDSK